MAFTRKYPRFDVRFTDRVIARLQNAKGDFRLITIGGGGCAFVGEADLAEFAPPQDLPISFELYEGQRCLFNKDVIGKLIYVRPDNITHKWLLGFSFGPNDCAAVVPMVTKLESYVEQGLVERA